MSFRCINAFAYGESVYPGGYLIEDEDPLLATHAAHFERVGEARSTATEVAAAAPDDKREAPPQPPAPPAPAKKTPPAAKQSHHQGARNQNMEGGS